MSLSKDMPSTKALSTAIGVMLALALHASAASISFTSAPGPITSLAVNNDVQFSGAFAFPAFDASLGTLSAASVSYSVSRIDGFLYYASGLRDGEAHGFSMPFLEMEILQVGPSRTFATAQNDVPLGTFLAQPDFFLLIPMPNLGPGANGSATFRDSATLQFFSVSGQGGVVNIPFTVNGSVDGFASAFIGRQTLTTTATVTYSFASDVPEPSTLAMMLLAGAVFIWRIAPMRRERD